MEETKATPKKAIKLPTERKRSSQDKQTYWFEVFLWIAGIIAIHLPLIATKYYANIHNALEPQTAGEFGDFVGGYIGQIIALSGLCLLVAGVRIERRRSDQERFETKYLEFLQLHRDNVEEMELQQAKGRRVFVLMLQEWRCILNITRQIAQVEHQSFSQLQLLQIAYYVLFYGVGPASTRMLKSSLGALDESFVEKLVGTLENPSLKYDVQSDNQFPHIPFEGHQSRLGHYYRHLFQTVRFVESKSPIWIPKEDYTRTVRAQLSTHEQALLLLNSLTPMGAEWWNLELIDGYRLVHNIPEAFFDLDLELNPALLFGENYLEKGVEHKRGFDSLQNQFHPFIQLEEVWMDGIAVPLPETTSSEGDPSSLD